MRATRRLQQTSQHAARAALAALILLSSLATPLGVSAEPSVGKKLTATRNKMAATSKKIASAVKRREQIEVELEVAVERYNEANDKYLKAKARLKDINGQLAWTAKRLRYHERLLDYRVSGIYRRGDADIVAWVVEATDFNDLVTRMRMLTTIAEQDAGIVKKVRAIRERLDRLQLRQKVETERKQRQWAARKAAVRDIEAKEAQYAAVIKELKAYYAKLAKSERKLSAQYAAQLARERAAALGYEVGWRPPPGWVPPPGGRPEAVKLAMRELGKRYVWGAEGPNTFDCSGLMFYVYSQLGIGLPRVSREQYWVGMHVSRKDLLPGDLVFFSHNGGPSGIHHVGMYIGDGRYIHAPHSGDVVKISDLDSRRSFVGGTRI